MMFSLSAFIHFFGAFIFSLSNVKVQPGYARTKWGACHEFWSSVPFDTI